MHISSGCAAAAYTAGPPKEDVLYVSGVGSAIGRPPQMNVSQIGRRSVWGIIIMLLVLLLLLLRLLLLRANPRRVVNE